MPKILIADDEPNIVTLISRYAQRRAMRSGRSPTADRLSKPVRMKTSTL